MVLYIGCSCPTGKLRDHNTLDRVLLVTRKNRQKSTYVLTQTPHHKQAKPFHVFYIIYGLPWWFSGKESAFAMQCRRSRFKPWVRKIPWRRKWQPIPLFSPGEFHGQRSLVDYIPWDHNESDMIEWPTFSYIKLYIWLPIGYEKELLNLQTFYKKTNISINNILAYFIICNIHIYFVILVP